MLLPALGKAKSSARGILCKSNFKQLGHAMGLYVNDYDENYPYHILTRTDGLVGSFWEVRLLRSWPAKLFPYFKDMGVCYCPDDYANIAEKPSDPYGGSHKWKKSSYFYRYCISHYAEVTRKKSLRLNEFKFPTTQVIMLEWNSWHGRNIRLNKNPTPFVGGISLNSLYVDGHVNVWQMSNFDGNVYDSNWFIHGSGEDPRKGYDD
jgi:prepilin-type processing-associated H-X9-DG protein